MVRELVTLVVMSTVALLGSTVAGSVRAASMPSPPGKASATSTEPAPAATSTSKLPSGRVMASAVTPPRLICTVWPPSPAPDA